MLYNALRLLLDSPGSTLLGLPRLLVDDRYRERLLKRCVDPVVAAYWDNEFAGYDAKFRAQVISPVQNKIGMLLSPPGLRLIIGQPRSTIDIARLMNEGDVLVANLAKGKIGATANCGNFAVFRIGAQDADVMAAELGIENARTLSDTSNFAAWAKLLQYGNPTDAFVLQTQVPVPPAKRRARAVIAHTQARHTRERAAVERMILRQLEE